MSAKAKNGLDSAGLFVEAVFSIPSRTFAPTTNISTDLVLVSRKQTIETFIAEISQDETRNRTILNNFRNQREGKDIHLGSFVDIKEYKTLSTLISEIEMQEMVKRIQFPTNSFNRHFYFYQCP